jgi:CRP-like cAMP-binding protein
VAEARQEAMTRVARQLFLRQMNPLRTNARSAARFADMMEDLYLPKGTVIYRKGEAAERIYFIVSGSVRLVLEGTEDWMMNERSVIGVIDANLERPRLRTAVADTDVHLLVLRADDYYEYLEDNFEQTRLIAYNLANGLRSFIATLAPTGGFLEPEEEPSSDDARPLTPVEKILVLRNVPAFRRASIQPLTQLAEVVEEMRIAPDDAPFQRQLGSLLLVARGLVQVDRAEPKLSARFGPRSIVGGFATLGEQKSTLTVRALRPSLLLKLSEERLCDVMEDHFDLSRSILAHGASERERMMPLKTAAEREITRAANL